MMEWYFSSVTIADLAGNTGDYPVDDFFSRLEKDIQQVVDAKVHRVADPCE